MKTYKNVVTVMLFLTIWVALFIANNFVNNIRYEIKGRDGSYLLDKRTGNVWERNYDEYQLIKKVKSIDDTKVKYQKGIDDTKVKYPKGSLLYGYEEYEKSKKHNTNAF